jgi:hypothetical protein
MASMLRLPLADFAILYYPLAEIRPHYMGCLLELQEDLRVFLWVFLLILAGSFVA